MNRKQRRASFSEGRRLQKLEFNQFEDTTIESNKKHRILNPIYWFYILTDNEK